MDLTDLILRWQSGEKEVEQQLYLYAYEHLKVIAQQERLRSSQKFGEHNPVFNELSNNTTALINEAYVKLSQYSDCDVGNRKQFYLLVSKVIRQILVDQARYFGAQKRQEITISERPKDLNNIIEINQIIDSFCRKYPAQGEVVKLKYFLGMSVKEISTLLQSSASKIEKDLSFSKSWLRVHCS
ncbi:ECF-type sigma factor [Vibrio genomosp. F10]|uniref:ECF-type sigma factor n=2 Tax=Vibrio genomosp. F10 TaxID=723171 RepID=UPI0003177FB9|nr:ECF-type sigma factor [Vibrio genomosp. F10]OEE92667.1 hypothetical protein A1QK_17520 [Vibrio genomosp. F10 str. 9ZD137]OEF04186.1 hypothetical protein A1QI_11880 [Vibrio genomosp. F10 str. 9ZB36]